MVANIGVIVGSILFICGAVPALIGIVWTTVYPSSDPHVIAPLCIGAFFLILFALWERYGNIKHRLTPTYVFTASHGRDLTAPLIALGVVNMVSCSSKPSLRILVLQNSVLLLLEYHLA